MLKKSFVVLLCITFFRFVNSMVPPTNCTDLLDIFASHTTNFTSCALSNSRPITLCESCVVPYLNTLDSYTNMTKSLVNGTACIDYFINLDRLQIVQTMHENSHHLWNRAKCYECFNVVNGTLTPEKSNETKSFRGNLDKLWKCIDRKDINDTTLCPTCIDDYLTLNDFYLSISNENEKIGVCMDIVDLMNTTRSFWSSKCCEFRKHNEFLFLFSAIAFLVITPMFYVLAQLYVEKKVPAILKQSRFAESLGHSIN